MSNELRNKLEEMAEATIEEVNEDIITQYVEVLKKENEQLKAELEKLKKAKETEKEEHPNNKKSTYDILRTLKVRG